RVNEINFNASLLSELRGVAFVNRLIDEGRLPRGTREGELRRLKLHLIVMEELGDTFGARSTLKTDYEYFETLRKLGQRATASSTSISTISGAGARSISRTRSRPNWRRLRPVLRNRDCLAIAG